MSFSRIVDSFFRRGEFGVTVPVMDGPLQPNQKLEEATVELQARLLDNLVTIGSEVVFSSEEALMRWTEGSGSSSEITRFESPITCLASDGQGGLAVGLDAGIVLLRGGRHNGKRLSGKSGTDFNCPTALLFLDQNTLLIANGSATFKSSEWKRDLMSLGRSGSVWLVDISSGNARKLVDKIGFPYGLAVESGTRVLVSCAWQHRVISVDTGGKEAARTVLSDLPGYPSRIIPAKSGGYWLTLFAARSQLIEFVLREKEYRTAMMAEIPVAYWVGPDLTSGKSFLEPLQGGSIKQMGILKPWAPPRSYGLVVRCDESLRPISSYHSRADGMNHGITSICEIGDVVLAGAKGPGLAVKIPIDATEGRAS